MRTGTIVLQLTRIAALVVLLAAATWVVRLRYRSLVSFDLAEMRGSWVLMTLVNVAFIAVVLVGRRARHPWPVLTTEAVIAAPLALVPAVQWALWFGMNQWTDGLVSGPVPLLALAWLGVVVATGLQQVRASREAPPHPWAPGATPPQGPSQGYGPPPPQASPQAYGPPPPGGVAR